MLMNVNALCPVVFDIWRSYETFKMWDLAVGSISLGASFESV